MSFCLCADEDCRVNGCRKGRQQAPGAANRPISFGEYLCYLCGEYHTLGKPCPGTIKGPPYRNAQVTFDLYEPLKKDKSDRPAEVDDMLAKFLELLEGFKYGMNESIGVAYEHPDGREFRLSFRVRPRQDFKFCHACGAALDPHFGRCPTCTKEE